MSTRTDEFSNVLYAFLFGVFCVGVPVSVCTRAGVLILFLFWKGGEGRGGGEGRVAKMLTVGGQKKMWLPLNFAREICLARNFLFMTASKTVRCGKPSKIFVL